ncbi:MAG TPA: type II toxin-antitoxin system PemK/MazF family toxin [Acidimicrobiales bacterium]|nr:type II toxin-antitoxin system PemK/MazF family toxin [Acidimicrobiales bacterium]
MVKQGELWWAMVDKRRPVLVLTRDEAIGVLNSVLVAPGTRTLRKIASEVVAGTDEGLPAETAFSFDNLTTLPKTMLRQRIGELGVAGRARMCAAVGAVLDC